LPTIEVKHKIYPFEEQEAMAMTFKLTFAFIKKLK